MLDISAVCALLSDLLFHKVHSGDGTRLISLCMCELSLL